MAGRREQERVQTTSQDVDLGSAQFERKLADTTFRPSDRSTLQERVARELARLERYENDVTFNSVYAARVGTQLITPLNTANAASLHGAALQQQQQTFTELQSAAKKKRSSGDPEIDALVQQLATAMPPQELEQLVQVLKKVHERKASGLEVSKAELVNVAHQLARHLDGGRIPLDLQQKPEGTEKAVRALIERLLPEDDQARQIAAEIGRLTSLQRATTRAMARQLQRALTASNAGEATANLLAPLSRQEREALFAVYRRDVDSSFVDHRAALRERIERETLGQALDKTREELRTLEEQMEKLEERIAGTWLIGWRRVSGRQSEDKQALRDAQDRHETLTLQAHALERAVEESRTFQQQALDLELLAAHHEVNGREELAQALFERAHLHFSGAFQALEAVAPEHGSALDWSNHITRALTPEIEVKLLALSTQFSDGDTLAAERAATLLSEAVIGYEQELHLRESAGTYLTELEVIVSARFHDHPEFADQLLRYVDLRTRAILIDQRVQDIEDGKSEARDELLRLLPQQDPRDTALMVQYYYERTRRQAAESLQSTLSPSDAPLVRALLSDDAAEAAAGAVQLAVQLRRPEEIGALQALLAEKPEKLAPLNEAHTRLFGAPLHEYLQQHEAMLYSALTTGDVPALAKLSLSAASSPRDKLARFQVLQIASGLSQQELLQVVRESEDGFHPLREVLREQQERFEEQVRKQINSSAADAANAASRLEAEQQSLRNPLTGIFFVWSGASATVRRAVDADLSLAAQKHELIDTLIDRHHGAARLAQLGESFEHEAARARAAGDKEEADAALARAFAAYDEAALLVGAEPLLLQTHEHRQAMRRELEGYDRAVAWCDSTDRTLRMTRKGALIIGATASGQWWAVGALGATSVASNSLEAGFDVAYGNKTGREALGDATRATASDALDITITRVAMWGGGRLAGSTTGALVNSGRVGATTARIGGAAIAGGTTSAGVDAAGQGFSILLFGQQEFSVRQTLLAGAAGTVGGAMGGAAQRGMELAKSPLGSFTWRAGDYAASAAFGAAMTDGDAADRVLGAVYGMAGTRAGEMHAASAAARQGATGTTTRSDVGALNVGEHPVIGRISATSEPTAPRKSAAERVSVAPPEPVATRPVAGSNGDDAGAAARRAYADAVLAVDATPTAASNAQRSASSSRLSPTRRKLAVALLSAQQVIAPAAGFRTAAAEMTPAPETTTRLVASEGSPTHAPSAAPVRAVERTPLPQRQVEQVDVAPRASTRAEQRPAQQSNQQTQRLAEQQHAPIRAQEGRFVVQQMAGEREIEMQYARHLLRAEEQRRFVEEPRRSDEEEQRRSNRRRHDNEVSSPSEVLRRQQEAVEERRETQQVLERERRAEAEEAADERTVRRRRKRAAVAGEDPTLISASPDIPDRDGVVRSYDQFGEG